jgi:DNA-binding transcriptional LysR family regulator
LPTKPSTPANGARPQAPARAAPPRTRHLTSLRGVEEKLEHVAAGHGIIVLPLSATQYYSRTDVVYVPVVDAELDQVYLACEATRRSKLISGFVQVAQRVLGASQTAPG